MPRFYRESLPGAALSDAIPLDSEQSKHLVKVLRLEVGAQIELFNGKGRLAHATLLDTGERTRQAEVRIDRVVQVDLPSPQIEIATAIPKGPRADTMIEQLSQLGVARLIPLRSERSVVDPRDAKLTRFRRAAIESAKQCGRLHLMEIDEVTPLDMVFERHHDLRLIAHPRASQPQGLGFEIRRARRMLVLVGPEGGFTADEVDLAKRQGCKPWSLGPHILRVETAATLAAGLAAYFAQHH